MIPPVDLDELQKTPLAALAHPTEAGLWAFAAERWAVQVAKEAGAPRPWTTDRLLADYHFTCVRREDDVGSRWYLTEIAAHQIDVGLSPALLWRTIFYRLVNRVSWFEEVWPEGLPGPSVGQSALAERISAGPWPWSPAYKSLLSPRPGSDRRENLLHALKWLAENLPSLTTAIAEATRLVEVRKILCRVPFVADFLAMQIYLDLLAAGALPFTPDDDVVIGPGALWSVQRLAGTWQADGPRRGGRRETWRVPRKASAEDEAWLRELAARQPAGAPWGRLHLCNVQSVLCEYSKYSRLTAGTGKTRRYTPRARP